MKKLALFALLSMIWPACFDFDLCENCSKIYDDIGCSDRIHSNRPYALGSTFRVTVESMNDLPASVLELRSSASKIIRVLDATGEDPNVFTCEAVGTGQTWLKVVSASGDTVFKLRASVAMPTRVVVEPPMLWEEPEQIYSAGIDFGPDPMLVRVGNRTVLRARYFCGDTELRARSAFEVDALGIAMRAEILHDYANQGGDYLRLIPEEPGFALVRLVVADVVMRAFKVEALPLAEFSGVSIWARFSDTPFPFGQCLVAVAYTEDGWAGLADGFAWTFAGERLEDMGAVLCYSAEGENLHPVQVELGGMTDSMQIQGEGPWVFDFDEIEYTCCSSSGRHPGIPALMLFVLVFFLFGKKSRASDSKSQKSKTSQR